MRKEEGVGDAGTNCMLVRCLLEQEHNTVFGRDSKLEYWNALACFFCFRLVISSARLPHYNTISMVREMTMTIPMMMMQITKKVKWRFGSW